MTNPGNTPPTTPPATPLKITECMTFPRSGHGLLERLLKDYFGEERLRYSEMYVEPEKTFGNDANTNFQKNHDLDLETTLHDDRQYLVQIRYPLESLVSWFKLRQGRGELRDAPDEWVNFALQQASFWCRFYRKWVMNPMPRRMILNYSDLMDDPIVSLTRAVEFMGETTPDAGRIKKCVEAQGVARKNDYRNFKYYGAEYFKLLKGLFAAVPGVDIENDLLVVPSAYANPDAGESAIKTSAHELKCLGEDLKRISDRLANEITGASDRAGATTPGSLDVAQAG